MTALPQGGGAERDDVGEGLDPSRADVALALDELTPAEGPARFSFKTFAAATGLGEDALRDRLFSLPVSVDLTTGDILVERDKLALLHRALKPHPGGHDWIGRRAARERW